ncbi:pyruvate synthase subunit PorA [Methanocaldococcus indicus]|uniref:pyruvate synthase subunit PorA n=1 Tax=Methanocaldococcus indicus TaxID=213231 RepID=UPI003C6CD13A
MKKIITRGTYAAAEAVRLADVDVVAAYPITPQTECVEKIAEFIANGELDAEYIRVESEHSAISALVGASAAGARTFTATASQGLALMHEILYIASGLRLPIVMANVNRALSAPINIWCDHQDSISERDTGWIQFYAESCQEVFDLVLQAFRIAEDKDVLLPVMVNLDGFILSHTYEPIEMPENDEAKEFVGVYEPPHYCLNPDNPVTVGSVGVPECYMETRKQLNDAIENSRKVIKKVHKEYANRFGRVYDFVETYNLENADTVLVAMGSVCGTIKYVISKLKEKGIVNVGLLKISCYRPFPKEEVKKYLKDVENIAVLDKNVCFGFDMGSLGLDITATLRKYDNKICNYIVGLGGRDIKIEDINKIIEDVQKAKDDKTEWIGLLE